MIDTRPSSMCKMLRIWFHFCSRRERILMKSIPHNDLRTYAREPATALIKIRLVSRYDSRRNLRKKLVNLMKQNDLNTKSFCIQISLV